MRCAPLVIVGSFIVAGAAHSQSTPCDAPAFRQVVSAASASINDLHEKNNKLFQEGLQKLRAASGWSDADFVAKATPFVKDEVTSNIDADNQALLAKVQSLGTGDAASEGSRCAMLGELKSLMEKVVANTAGKWRHMIEKVNAAPGVTLQAGAAH